MIKWLEEYSIEELEDKLKIVPFLYDDWTKATRKFYREEIAYRKSLLKNNEKK